MAAQQRKRINISLLIPFMVIALVFGAMLWQKYRDSRELPVAPQRRCTVLVVVFASRGRGRERVALSTFTMHY